MALKDDQIARKEANDIRTNVGWYKFTHNLTVVTGKDAARFLDYMCLYPIANLSVGRSRYTTVLNEDGQILDDVIVIYPEPGVYWVSTLDYPSLAAWFETQKAGFDVSWHEATHEIDMYAVQGPNSKKMIELAAKNPLSKLAYFAITENIIVTLPVKILRAGFTGELGYEIYVASNESENLEKLLATACAILGGSNTTSWDVIARAIPVEKGYVLPADILGLTPYEIGSSVDLTREFVGKQALAAAGTSPSRLLLGLEFDDFPASEGDLVFYQGENVGNTTCVTYSFYLDKYIGYAILDAHKAPVGTNVIVGEEGVTAKVVERIWYDPDNLRVRG
ncbi:MAG: aminomethyl transferase family protein [Coriobacteriia bacterium]|nr:aminomethyl transferase family protein [Coriobacteriia bacterium]